MLLCFQARQASRGLRSSLSSLSSLPLSLSRSSSSYSSRSLSRFSSKGPSPALRSTAAAVFQLPLAPHHQPRRLFTMNAQELSQYLADAPPAVVRLEIEKHFTALTDKQKRYAHFISR